MVNWLVYYPIERWFSRYTDILITINHEDYDRAKTFQAKKVEYIPGVGVDTKKFSPENFSVSIKEKMRQELNIKEDTVVLFSVGELSGRKNHKVVIEAIGRIKNENIKYIIAGTGPSEDTYNKMLKKLGIEDKVQLLGFRKDIKELCSMSDIFVFPSLQEGLPVALMEAMASGLSVVCSDIRGNVDLIQDGQGGFCCNVNDIDVLEKAIYTLYNDAELRREYGNFNLERVKQFDIKKIEEIMSCIYKHLYN